VLKSGGETALTKPLHEESLKCPIGVDDVKVEISPKTIDNTMIIESAHLSPKPRTKVKTRIVKAKAISRKSRLENVTSHLYDLEDNNEPEKTLNIDFGLYQMENY
jgi:hypothetical protein